MIDFTQVGKKVESAGSPAPFRQTTPHTFEVKKGGGMIAVFGLPFFLAGVCMALAAIGVLPQSADTGNSEPTVMLGLSGLVFLSVGGIMVFGRQWLILDISRGSVIRQFGLLIPMHTKLRSLSDFNAVVLSHDPGASESPETYPVTLRASIGKDIAIAKPLKFDESHRLAEFFARTLRLRFVDATTDHETILNPDSVGKSLVDRLASGLESAAPYRPLTMRSEVHEGAAETRIVIPAGGPGTTGYFGVLLPFAVILVAMPVAIPFLVRSQTPTSRLILLGVLLLIFGIPTIFACARFMVASRRRKTTVTISRSGLLIEQPRGRETRTIEIPAGDLLDLDSSTVDSALRSARQSVDAKWAHRPDGERVLATLRRLLPNPGIVIKSRAALVTIGEGLSAEELQYLVWLLKRALAG